MFNSFESASSPLRLLFDSASRQIPNSFVTASAGLRLAFGGKRRAPEELPKDWRIREESGTNLVPGRGVN
ncbi:MAG: hypothetical protein K9G42_09595 [Pedobacter sp.]|nr:hypothetical protein [Pedobacter sp.]